MVLYSYNVAWTQTVPFPTNPDPTKIEPWGYDDDGTNWDTSPYLPFIHDYVTFRLMPPNGVTYDGATETWAFEEGEKYPIIMFFHGRGEAGNGNNLQLKHGGKIHKEAVQSGKFPGFLMFPQNADAATMKKLFDRLIEEGLPIDKSRVYVHGLSGGANYTWKMLLDYPELVAAAFPMSGAVDEDYTDVIYTPIRLVQGGLDKNPVPSFTNGEVTEIQNLGGHIEYFYLENSGHGTWNNMYNRNDFFPWFLEQSIQKIFVRYDYKDVCPEDEVDVSLGVSPGNAAYEWTKNGVVIEGESGHELHVTEYGDYSVRVLIDDEWTSWAETVTVEERQPTQTPPISQTVMSSTVLPDPNGSTTVQLTLPEGYETYEWYRGEILVGTNQVLDATPGVYRALVQELYGCSSQFSEPYEVLGSTGVDIPEVPSNLAVSTASKTELIINWNDNSNNESGFELYRRGTINEPYALIAVLGEGAVSYTDEELLPGTDYIYSLRAINVNGASPLTPEISGLTDRDQVNPSAPSNLRISATTNFSVSLEWEESTDDVGIKKYDVYQDGVKVLSTTNTDMTIYNLTEGVSYKFNVVAVDVSNNVSAFSNRVIAVPVFAGLNYKYFEGSWGSALPDFDALTPIKTGVTENVDISTAEQGDNFAFYWEGYIKIPVAGEYTFETYSDDGSRLYIGEYGYNVTPLVDNDGLHGSRYREGTYDFPAAGAYPIVITYFEKTGGNTMRVYWKNTAHGIGNSRQLVPSSAFADEVNLPNELVESPSEVVATAVSTEEILLTWNDNSDNEISFQVFRAQGEASVYSSIAVLPAGTTEYTDSGLAPGTTYFYKAVALGEYSQSEMLEETFEGVVLQLELDNNLDDDSGQNGSSTLVKTPLFDEDQRVQGSHSLYFHGSADYVNLDNSNRFIHEEFSERSVAFWVYANVTSGIQDLFDEGGSTNGIGIRINNGTVELAVRDDQNMMIVSGAIQSNKWVHIVGVFEQGYLGLYLDGVLVAEELNVGYTEVSAHSDAGGLGATNGSNAFDESNNNFNGWIDDLFVFDQAITSVEVARLIQRSVDTSKATTFELPKPTDPPVDVEAAALSNRSVELTWSSTGASAYLVYRSEGNDQNFTLAAVRQGGLLNYRDSTLTPRMEYFYVVRSFSEFGYSVNSDTVSVSTLNTTPALETKIPDYSLFFSENISLLLTAQDDDNDIVSFEGVNFPSFVDLSDNGDNTALLSITPQAVDEGVYEQIAVVVNDGFEDSMVYFDVSVISNHDPVIVPLETYNMLGGESLSVEVAATDQNGENLSWSFSNLPSFASYEVSESGESVNLTFNPSLSDDGGQHVITIHVEDDNPIRTGVDEIELVLQVVAYDPQHKLYVNFGDQSEAPEPWNNMMIGWPGSGTALSGLINDQGFPMDVSITLESGWNGVGVAGGMPTGIYEDPVRMSYFWTDNSPEYIRVSGLDQSSTYNFEFFGSRNKSGDRTTIFGVGGQTSSLQAAFNTNDVARIEGVIPDENGELVISVENISGSSGYSVAYLNSMVIEAISQEGLAPLAPTGLQLSSSPEVELEWIDNSYNETAFEIYRSSVDENNYELIDTTPNNTYVDNATGQVDQFYKVRAVNQFGYSSFSASVHYTYTNRAPVFGEVSDIIVNPNVLAELVYEVTDPEANPMFIEVIGLPDFAEFTQIDANHGRVDILASIYDLGAYEFELHASDDQGNSSIVTVQLAVTDVAYEVALVNLSEVNIVAPSPWNNLIGTPEAGLSISNINDTEGQNTGMALTLIDGWAGGNSNGVITGDDSGVYPDVVMNTYLADNSTLNKEMVLSGLDESKTYELVFFGSRAAVSDARVSIYTVNGVSVNLNVSNNSSETATISAIKPNEDGEIRFTVNKLSGAPFKYINALEIRYYEEPEYPDAPSGLVANAKSKQAIDLSWNDNSGNEDGFEIYTSDDANGPWELLAIVGANVTSYEDSDLTPNTVYYYQVRAFNEVSPSLYSEVVGESTYSYVVLLNIGDESAIAAAPWNNTAQDPFVGNVTANLKNDQGNNTGISMEIIENVHNTKFDAAGNLGAITGDDSGVFPDVVTQSYYWWVQGDYVSLKFSSLPLNQQFDFEFFGSRAGPERGSTFIIDGESVSLNVSYNTSETVTIRNVVSDELGDVYVDMTSMAGLGNAYINAIVIRASSAFGDNAQYAARTVGDSSVDQETESQELQSYPNPFDNSLTISGMPSDEELSIAIFDQMGKTVYRDRLQTIGQKINVNTAALRSGLYFVQVQTESSKVVVFKMAKR
ncbi:hypothetical protein BFP72_04005 [Reichenbachiella sp. 5M10]|nr:hypothetical protein BFP72_04005 [Reichenbachiella sp. 5M10]